MALFRLLLLVALFAPITFRAVTDEGNGFDPHGRPGTSSLSSDDGAGLDPHGGRCTPANKLYEGSGIDPHG